MTLYTVSTELSLDALKQLQYDLKSQMAVEMCAIQNERARGENPSWWREKYVAHAQALRGVNEALGKDSYRPVCRFTVYVEDQKDPKYWDYEGSLPVRVLCELAHADDADELEVVV